MDLYEIFEIISTICTVLCILLTLLTVALFFLFEIPKVFGFLNGSTARKSVRQLEGELSSGSMVRSNAGKGASLQNDAGYITPITNAVTPQKQAGAAPQYNQLNATASDGMGATSLLNEAGATSVLGTAGATTLLSAEVGATSLLGAADPVIMTPQMQKELGMGLTESLEESSADFKIGTFNIVQKIIFVHAEEVI